MALDYAGRCQRYARQRGWAYDEHKLSIGHLTPRQKHRAIKKERHQWPGYSRRAIDMPWDARYAAYNLDELTDEDVLYDFTRYYDGDGYSEDADLGYCVTPGCNCCGGD